MLFTKKNNKLKLIVSTTFAATLIASPGIAMYSGEDPMDIDLDQTTLSKDDEIDKLGLKITEEIQSLTEELTNAPGNASSTLFQIQCRLYNLLSSTTKDMGTSHFPKKLLEAISESLNLYHQELLNKVPDKLKEKIHAICLENADRPITLALNVLKTLAVPSEIEAMIDRYEPLLRMQFSQDIPTGFGMDILKLLEKTYHLSRSAATQVLLSIPYQQEDKLKRKQLLVDFGKYLGDMKTRQPLVLEVLATMSDEFEKSCLLTGFCRTYDGDPELIEAPLRSITDPSCHLMIKDAIESNSNIATYFKEFISKVKKATATDPRGKQQFPGTLRIIELQDDARVAFTKIESAEDFSSKYNLISELCKTCPCDLIPKLIRKIIELLDLEKQCGFQLPNEQTYNEVDIKRNFCNHLLQNRYLTSGQTSIILLAKKQLELVSDDYDSPKHFPDF